MSKIDFFKVPETFSKCFPSYSDRLSGLVSASKWFWTYPHRLWKKSIFWWKNAHLVRNGLWGQKWEWAFFSSKNRFFQNSWNFEDMYPIVFGPALRSCFSLWMIFNLPSPSLKKIDFSMKKTRFLVRDSLWVQKWGWTFFSSKNRFFSKTVKVGSKSFRGWNKSSKPVRIQ